jgi:hypothetical protein
MLCMFYFLEGHGQLLEWQVKCQGNDDVKQM